MMGMWCLFRVRHRVGRFLARTLPLSLRLGTWGQLPRRCHRKMLNTWVRLKLWATGKNICHTIWAQCNCGAAKQCKWVFVTYCARFYIYIYKGWRIARRCRFAYNQNEWQRNSCSKEYTKTSNNGFRVQRVGWLCVLRSTNLYSAL